MVSENSLTVGNKKPTPQTPHHNINQSTCYYIFCLIGNVLLISMYAVQVLGQHKTCLVDDVNITKRLDFAFGLGFAIVIADFTNSSILVLLKKSTDNTSHCGFTTNELQVIHVNEMVMRDWVIIILTLLVSIVQFMIISSQGFVFCSVLNDTLVFESKWLSELIVC